MQFDAPLGQLDRKCGRVRSFFLPALDRLVGNEPGVSPATEIFAAGVSPARDIALVLIRHAQSEPVDFNAAGLGEVKNVFVTIVQKSLRVNWLEMAVQNEPHRLCLRH